MKWSQYQTLAISCGLSAALGKEPVPTQAGSPLRVNQPF